MPAHLRAVPVTPAHPVAVPALGVPATPARVPAVPALAVLVSMGVLAVGVLVGDVVPPDGSAATLLRLSAASGGKATRGGQAGLRRKAMTPAPDRPVGRALFAATARRAAGPGALGQRVPGFPGPVRRGDAAMARAAVTATISTVTRTTAPVAIVRLVHGGAEATVGAGQRRELAGTAV